MHTLWCTISLKKNSRFPAKSRKQRVGIFCPRQIYGSKGSYRQNILNMGVSAITRCSVFAMTLQKKAHGAALLSCQRSWIILQIIVACLCYRNGRCGSRGKRTRSGAGSKLGILGAWLSCRRNVSQKSRALATNARRAGHPLLCGEKPGPPRGLSTPRRQVAS